MSLPNYMGCLMQFYKSLLLYYTEMCFEILNFFQRKSVFFHEKSTLLRVRCDILRSSQQSPKC
jgi:hypothetical protein